VFLAAQFGDAIVREVLEAEGASGGPALAATDAVLAKHASSLADAFATFSAWNVATGDRAGTGGYADAATYPQAKLGAVGANASVQGITSGLGAFAYAIHAATPQAITIATDASRNRAQIVPLEGGKARLDRVAPLPATVQGDAIVVVSATTTKKSDGPFTLTAADAPSEADGGEPTAPSRAASSGCAASRGRGASDGALVILAIMAVIAQRRRAR